jgi:hypothetical protein
MNRSLLIQISPQAWDYVLVRRIQWREEVANRQYRFLTNGIAFWRKLDHRLDELEKQHCTYLECQDFQFRLHRIRTRLARTYDYIQECADKTVAEWQYVASLYNRLSDQEVRIWGGNYALWQVERARDAARAVHRRERSGRSGV